MPETGPEPERAPSGPAGASPQPLPWHDPAVIASVSRKIVEQGLSWDTGDWRAFDFTDREWVFLEWADFPVAIRRRYDTRTPSVGLMQWLTPSPWPVAPQEGDG